jgi:hypothetical protein
LVCGSVAGRRARKETSNNIAGEKGWHSRETELKESKCEEGHVALVVCEVANRVPCSHIWVKLCFFVSVTCLQGYII